MKTAPAEPPERGPNKSPDPFPVPVPSDGTRGPVGSALTPRAAGDPAAARGSSYEVDPPIHQAGGHSFDVVLEHQPSPERL